MLKQSRPREMRVEGGDSATMKKVTLYHNPG
jgi:hypothetical protein